MCFPRILWFPLADFGAVQRQKPVKWNTFAVFVPVRARTGRRLGSRLRGNEHAWGGGLGHLRPVYFTQAFEIPGPARWEAKVAGLERDSFKWIPVEAPVTL